MHFHFNFLLKHICLYMSKALNLCGMIWTENSLVLWQANMGDSGAAEWVSRVSCTAYLILGNELPFPNM